MKQSIENRYWKDDMAEPEITKYLPLTEATYYILLALAEPLHGYAVMQKVEAVSDGAVKIGPGTLYGAFTNLEKEGLIRLVKQEARRKSYALTDKGCQVLTEQIKRVEIMSSNGQTVLPKLQQRKPL
jgi:DNA-binding PadR family transcriptional regulator